MRFLSLALILAGFSPLVLARADDAATLSGPLKTVTDQYLTISNQLCADSVDGVPAATKAMKQAVDADHGKTFGADFAQAVDKLAAATDLHSTRIALQPVSGLLIATLARAHVQTGNLHSLFCPMVKAYWLQNDGKTVHNPYMGSEMPDCGSFQRQF